MTHEWCTRIIRWSFYSLFVIVPLVLTPVNYELFEYNKMMVTYGLTVVVVTAWLVKSISLRRFELQRTPLDIPILLFLLSQLVSTLFSIDPHVSWFGYYSRFNGGMWSLLSYVVLYYAFVSNLGDLGTVGKNKEAPQNPLIRLLQVMLWTAVVVSTYGLLQRLGIDKNLWVQDVQHRVFSTLGQPNWLAAYLIALIPVAQAMAIRSQLSHHIDGVKGLSKLSVSLPTILWSSIAWFFFMVLIFTRSRSGLAALGMTQAVFWGLLLVPQVTRKTATLTLTLFSFLCAGFIFFHGSNVHQLDSWVSLRGILHKIQTAAGSTRSQQSVTAPTASTTNALPSAPAPGSEGSVLLDGGISGSGVIRSFVWQGAIDAWKETPKTILIGTGTETFAFAFFQHKPAKHNLTSEWDFLYNKAHNEYLNFLTTTGILGLGTYVLLLGMFGWWFVRSKVSTDNHHDTNKQQSSIVNQRLLTIGPWQIVWHLDFGIWTLTAALFAGWLSLLITNFFGFSVVITQLLLFIFPAMILLVSHRDAPEKRQRVMAFAFPQGAAAFLMTAAALMSAGLVIMILVSWQADTLFASGYRNNRAGQFAQAQQDIASALVLSPFEPLYYDELATSYAGLTAEAIQNRDATAAAARLKLAVASSDRAVSTSPNNVNFWKTRTKVFYAVAETNPQFFANSIEALEKGLKLSPNDPKILYNLAVLEGRRADGEKAIRYLEKAMEVKPNYKDAYYALYLFLDEAKRTPEARAVLEKYLATIDPKDEQFKGLLAK